MYINFKGKKAELYNNNKSIVRKFNTTANIVNAQVTGEGENAIIALTMSNGKTILYKSNGQIIRR